MFKFCWLPILLFFFLSNDIYATHLRAGDITARVINLETRSYEFTLTLYRDSRPGHQDQSKATLNFGDNSKCVEVDLLTREVVNNQTEKLIYKFRHSYSGDGNFLVTFNEVNRNPEINNIAGGNSINISFYLETLVVIDAFNGINDTPVLLTPPIDEAAKGQIFIHNPAAFDIDGDSLSYSLTVPKANTGGGVCNSGEPYDVPLYISPADPSFWGKSESGGVAELTLDPITGDLILNTPGKEGLYNVAFVVQEWRKINGEWVKLGFVTRDTNQCKRH